jgi:protocatechuate 3,4-dioxygenase beta subunit
MLNLRISGVLFVLLALGAVGAWFVWSSDTAVDLPVGTQGTANAAGGEADAVRVAVPGGADETSTRVAVPSAAAGTVAAVDAKEHGLFGRVVDDLGAPVAGATVRCSVGLGAGMDFENFDPADFEGFDAEAMAERWKQQQRERTEATTDVDGRFRLLATGTARNVSLKVLARSYVVLDKNVPRPVDADADLGVLTLKRGVVLSGRVVDRSGGAVAEARVQRQDPRGGRGGFDFDFEFPGADSFEDATGEEVAKTDADGRFLLTHCEAGQFSLRARHPEHPSSTVESLTAQPGTVMEGVIIVVEPGAVLSGRVLGVPDGQKPLRVMASVRRDDTKASDGAAAGFLGMMGGDIADLAADAGFAFGEKSVATGSDFTFSLRGLQVGKSYRIWAVQGGRGFADNALCTERLEAASGTTGLELRYDTGITVTFVALDAKTGAPIERLWVKDQLRGGGGMEDMMSFMPRSGRSKSYPEGQVTISNLRPKKKQSLQLSIDAIGYASFERKDIALPTMGALDLGVVKLDPAPVLEVIVRSAVDLHPVAGATVRLEGKRQGDQGNDNPFAQFTQLGGAGGGGPRTGKTDADGRCLLNAMTGVAVVTVRTKEFAPYSSDPIDLPAGKGGKHEAVLVRGGSVAVAALDSDGQPLGEGRVEHSTPAGERDSRDLDKQGRSSFERLVPGEHRFRLAKPRGNGPGMDMLQARLGGARAQPAQDDPDWQVVVVEDGGKASIELKKAATAKLHGMVRENGVPLAGARVSFLEGAEDNQGNGGLEGRIADMMGGMGGQGRGGRTGKDGSYELADLPAGFHRLRVTTRERVMPATVSVTLRLGDNVFDVDLDATSLRGTVKDQAGSPVAGASVSIVPAKPKGTPSSEQGRMLEEVMGGMDFAGMQGGGRSQVKTDAEGNYELRGVQAGQSLQVRATAKGYSPANSPVIEVPQSGTQMGVDITLGAAGRVKVEVADAPQFAQVRAVNVTEDGAAVDGVAPVSQLMRRGKATLDGLSPGRWKVTVNMTNGTPRDPRFVEVTAGDTVTLNF